ncbi:MAG TPA: hypothetical protein VD789_01810, partial [Thermomicrobiales bacterium]|nr:hypothetical protein [Thermomicrobiales bacterium]
MRQNRYATNGRISRRAALAGGAALAGILRAGAAGAQTPVASPEATPGASPAATPVATPVPDYPLDIFPASDQPDDGRPRLGGTLRLPV